MMIDDHGADFAGRMQRVNAPIIVVNKTDKILEQIGSKRVSDYQSYNAGLDYSRDIETIAGRQSEKYYVPNVIKSHYGTKNHNQNDTYDYIYDRNGKRTD